MKSKTYWNTYKELLRSISAGKLPDDLIKEVGEIPPVFVDEKLVPLGIANPISMIHGMNTSPDVRNNIIRLVKEEINYIIDYESGFPEHLLTKEKIK